MNQLRTSNPSLIVISSVVAFLALSSSGLAQPSVVEGSVAPDVIHLRGSGLGANELILRDGSPIGRTDSNGSFGLVTAFDSGDCQLPLDFEKSGSVEVSLFNCPPKGSALTDDGDRTRSFGLLVAQGAIGAMTRSCG